MKFRIYSKKDNDYVNDLSNIFNCENNIFNIKDDNYIMEPYTNINDMNDKEIYLHDIVSDTNNKTYRVDYDFEIAQFIFVPINGDVDDPLYCSVANVKWFNLKIFGRYNVGGKNVCN